MRSWNRIRLKPPWLVVALLVAWTSYPLLSQKVETKADRSVDLSAYKTFAFEEAIRILTDPFFQHPQAEQWVRESLQENLAAAGYAHVHSQQPDFRIRISGRTELQERKVETGRVYNTFVEQFIQATLTVEFIEAGSRNVIWTGIASDRAFVQRKGIGITPQKARRKIRKAVRKMIQRFQRSASQPPSDA